MLHYRIVRVFHRIIVQIKPIPVLPHLLQVGLQHLIHTLRKSPHVITQAVKAIAVLFGAIRLMVKKKPLRKLGKFEIILGMIFGTLAVGIGIYVYYYQVMDVDFVNIVREYIDELIGFFKRE